MSEEPTTPKGYTITFPDAEGVRVFINETDAAALRRLGRKIAVVPAEKDPLVLGGSVYIRCPEEDA
jgi:hypothetical protein